MGGHPLQNPEAKTSHFLHVRTGFASGFPKKAQAFKGSLLNSGPMRGEPSFTWKEFLRSLRMRGGVLREDIDALRHRVYEEALEEEAFNPFTLASWGFLHLLPEGASLLVQRAREKGLSVGELAERVGVSSTLAAGWLKGKYVPKPRYFLALSRTLDIPIAQLRGLFPERGQEVVVRKELLDDGHLSPAEQAYRRLYFLRQKLLFLAERKENTPEDALWFANGLVLATSIWGLSTFRRILALEMRAVELLPTEGLVRVSGLYPHPRGTFTSRSLYPLYSAYLHRQRALLLQGNSSPFLFPAPRGDAPLNRIASLRDVLRPHRSSSLRTFFHRQAKELLGVWGYRRFTYRFRGKAERNVHRLGELWEAYLEYRLLRVSKEVAGEVGGEDLEAIFV